MAQARTLRCRGLYTFENNLSEIPEGALLEANNIVVDREGIISLRRGIKIYGSPITSAISTNRSKQALVYKKRKLRHYNTTIEYDSDGSGTFLPFTGSYSEPVSGIRIKSVEANGNLYFTTSNGIKKISILDASGLTSNLITDAGGVKALDLTCTLDYSNTGFFNQDSVIAYRIVWGIKDPNQNLILGSPSSRAVVENPITPLLTKDFNNLLHSLDLAAAANGGGILHFTDYLSTLKISINSNASTLYSSLQSLCAKIDLDLTSDAYEGRSGTISAISAANPTQITSTGHGLVTGDKITITNADASGNPNINGTFNITFVDANNFTVPVNVTTAGSHGDWAQSSISHNHPTPPSDTPTSQELLSLQNFYDEIVSQLLAETVGNITPAAQAAGNFTGSTKSAIVTVSFPVPTAVTTAHFYQVYRTPQVTSTGVGVLATLDPGDDEQLVFESNPTSGDISAGFITVSDITPESFLGANLYTNANSGSGILQANEVPPLANDIATFKNTTFYANTQTKQRLQLSLLSASELVGNTFIIGSNTYTFVSKAKQITNITCVAGAVLTQAGTADYFDIYSGNNTSHYRFWYSIGASVAPSGGAGITLIAIPALNGDTASQVASKTSDALAATIDFTTGVLAAVVTVTNEASGVTSAPTGHVANGGFSIVVSIAGTGENAATKSIAVSDAPTPAQEVDETARSIVRIVNRQLSEQVYAFYLSGPTDVPGLILFEARTLGISPVAFTVGNSAISNKFFPVLPTSGTSVVTNNEVSPNRIYYSKTQQPDAVPIVSYLDIGPKDKRIIRIVPLRDSLFVLTEGAVWRVYGDNPNFVVTLFDSSAQILADDSAAVLNNQIYLISTQGVVTISDTGVGVISRPIENQILPPTTYAHFRTSTFGISYESDRAYILFTVLKSADTVATQAFRYNVFTTTWTVLPISKTCGVVDPAVDRLYLGAADVPYMEEERKDFMRSDFCDREVDLNFSLNQLDPTGTILSIGNVSSVSVGDAITQTQYLTIKQYNRLLKHLDRIVYLQGNYLATIGANPGSDLSAKLAALVAKLNADPGTNTKSYTSSGSNVFTALQSDFNAIVALLNADTGVKASNFAQSTGTTYYETKVLNVNTFTNTITTTANAHFAVIVGPLVVFKAIQTSVIWAPQTFGDPSMLKHVREATIMFENDSFTTGAAAYSTDLSPGFKEVSFLGEGSGKWGGSPWGQFTWGGLGSSRPFRTYVPLEKQRCRFINCRFRHAQALEKFSITGVSFTFEMTSSRAYD